MHFILKKIKTFNGWVQHPLTYGLDIDDPQTTKIRHQILRQKPFLRKIYHDWYSLLLSYALKNEKFNILEIGSGAGFSSDYSKNIIKSDILHTTLIDIQCNAEQLAFRQGAFQSIIMVNVLHHLHDPKQFLKESSRCLMDGGTICMVEPWNTPWSKFVYSNFHYEQFDPSSLNWICVKGGPLSGSNQAIPWIIFKRDLSKFYESFQSLRSKEFNHSCHSFISLRVGSPYKRSCRLSAIPFGERLRNYLS